MHVRGDWIRPCTGGFNLLQRTETAVRCGRPRSVWPDLKETGGYRKLKEVPDRPVWRTGSGSGCGPVVRETAEWVNEWYLFTFCVECRVARMQTKFCQSCPHQIQDWQACLKECPSLLLAKKLQGLVRRSRPLDHALSTHSVLMVYLNLLKPNYIYIYMSYRSANLQTLHFKYLFNKYTYWIF